LGPLWADIPGQNEGTNDDKGKDCIYLGSGDYSPEKAALYHSLESLVRSTEVKMSKALGRIVLGLTALALIAFSRLAGAQANVTPDTAERRHALEIYSAGRYVDAMPLLENLVAEYPSDVQIREAWAFSIFAYSTSLSDPETRRKARIRARSVAVQAQKLGDKSPIVQMMLAIAEDGSEPSFSNRKDVDAATKDGEAAFARGDLDKARESYLRASILDSGGMDIQPPKSYLFHGTGSFPLVALRCSCLNHNVTHASRVWDRFTPY
jgi:hypothetical protein